MSEINTEDLFDQFIKSNKDLLKIATKFQTEIYQPIMDKEDEPTRIVQTKATKAADKLDKKEFTITVVGEIKAGKSTLINALVGYDISHARTTAATTFPLRIIHVENRAKDAGVDFTFEPDPKFWQLALDVKQKLSTLSEAFFNSISQYKNTINSINSGRFTKDSYNRKHITIDGVRNLLECLHDFPRLHQELFQGDADHLSIDEVIKLVTKIPEIILKFPAMEEFAHNDSMGKIILIDTPGVGENGKIDGIIKKLVKREIAESSAVMAVLEKGGKNSKNEAIIKEFIAECKAPSYLIAGQMDNYDIDGNDTPIEQLKIQMKTKYSDGGRLKIKEVLPISQQRAVQGLTALSYLEHNSPLPDPYKDDSITNKKKHWVSELIQGTHGQRSNEWKVFKGKKQGYEEILHEDAKEYQEYVREEWLYNEEFSFKALVDEFETISKNAETMILQSGKEDLSESLKIQMTTIDELQTQAGANAEDFESAIEKIKPLLSTVDAIAQDVSTKVARQRDLINQKSNNINNSINSNVDTFISNTDSNYSDDQLKDMTVGDSKKFLQTEANQIMNELTSVNNLITTDVAQIKQKVEKTTQELQAVMQQTFNINLSLQPLKIQEQQMIDLDIDARSFEGTEEHRTRHTRQVETEGFIGGAKRFLGGIFGGDDWGYEEETYYKTHTSYVFKRRDFLSMLSQKMKQELHGVIITFNSYAESRMNQVNSLQATLNNELQNKTTELSKLLHDRESDGSLMEKRIEEMAKMVSELERMQDVITGTPVPEIQE